MHAHSRQCFQTSGRVSGVGCRVWALPLRGAYAESTRSNTAMLSTWAVCGNMFTTPAATQR